MRTDIAFEIDPHVADVVMRGDSGAASIDVDPRGRTLALARGSWGGVLRGESFEIAHPLQGVGASARIEGRLRFVHEGTRLIASVNGALRVWSAADGSEIDRIESHDAGAILAVSPDGRRAITRAGTSSVALWDLDESRTRFRATLDSVDAAAFLDDGSPVVLSHTDGRAEERDVVLTRLDADNGGARSIFGETVPTHEVDQRGTYAEADRAVEAIRGTGRLLFGSEGTLGELDVGASRRAWRGSFGSISAIAISPAGDAFGIFPRASEPYLVRASDDARLVLSTGRNITDARFTVDGRLLLAVGENGVIRAWTWSLADRWG